MFPQRTARRACGWRSPTPRPPTSPVRPPGTPSRSHVSDAPTVVLAPTRATPSGQALHVRAVLVAPTRPGRLLAEAARRGFPVG